MLENKALYWVSLILVMVGGINTGLMGLFGADFIVALFGGLGRLILILVGLGAAFLITKFVKSGGMSDLAASFKKAKAKKEPAAQVPKDDSDKSE
jgi:uncharacterized protein